MELHSKMADAALTNTPQHIHIEPPLTSPINAESRIELPLSNRLGVFSFCPGWKSFHIPFLRGQRSASALPACPPWLPHAEWLVLTPSLPAAAILSNMWESFTGMSDSLWRWCQTRPEQAGSLWKTMIHVAGRCGHRSCLTKLYEQTKYRKWVHHPELRWQQPHSRGEEEGGVKCSGEVNMLHKHMN